jgi:MoxR-like ATPase
MQIVEAAKLSRTVLEALQQVIVGKEQVLEHLLLGLYSGGNILIEDFPGLAKTLTARLLAQVTGLDFKRIQFTPDLLPGDITGGLIYNQKQGEFEFRPGPLFTNLVLADEVNRAPPKTQAALLEVMQERQVTIEGTTYPVPQPFVVLATQNPIELEGTYPLPEAQLDRFMFHIVIEHPPENEELDVVRTTTAIQDPSFARTVTGADLVAFQRLVRRVPVSEPVLRYALSVVRTSRPRGKDTPEFIKKWVQFGASVRAAQYLVLGGKARALTNGRYNVSFEDIRALAHPVLRHRVLTNFHAGSEGITTDWIVDQLLDAVPVPTSGM